MVIVICQVVCGLSIEKWIKLINEFESYRHTSNPSVDLTKKFKITAESILKYKDDLKKCSISECFVAKKF